MSRRKWKAVICGEIRGIFFWFRENVMVTSESFILSSGIKSSKNSFSRQNNWNFSSGLIFLANKALQLLKLSYGTSVCVVIQRNFLERSSISILVDEA